MERLGFTHDATDDFLHPSLEEGHALCPHVLYKFSRERYAKLLNSTTTFRAR